MLDIDIIKKIPKVEIHLHLEGAVPRQTMWKLIKKYNENSEIESFEQLEKKYQFSNFGEFLKTWIWQSNFLKDYEDFTLIASDVAKDLVKQNIIYAEIFYSPFLESRNHLDPLKITEAIRLGFDKHKNNILFEELDGLCL